MLSYGVSIGKTCSARILQWINNPRNDVIANHRGGAEVIITSFVRVVYPLKYPSNACLSCLDNGYSCWNAIYLWCQNVIGVLPVAGVLPK